jgi:ABC-type phosphate transport system substrate-binding protein
MDRRLFSAWIEKILFVAFLGLSLPARGELAIIVNLQNDIAQLTKNQVVNIFLGNHREFPNGLRARPLDLPTDNPDKETFYRTLVNKDLNQMAAYWSRLVFAGNTSPPVQAGDTQEVIQAVANNRNAIGYINSQYVDPDRVRVVFALP